MEKNKTVLEQWHQRALKNNKQSKALYLADELDVNYAGVINRFATAKELRRLYEMNQILLKRCKELEEKRELVGLTEKELQEILQEVSGKGWKPMLEAIEAKLKEKNT